MFMLPTSFHYPN